MKNDNTITNPKSFGQKIIDFLIHDRWIFLLVTFNAFLIFIQGFELPDFYRSILIAIDDGITLLFIIELILKITRLGFKCFFASYWNTFDCILIVMAAPSLGGWLFNLGNAANLQYFLVLRLFRIFKFFLILRFFPKIDKIILAVRHALRTSVSVIFGFLVYNFAVSVVSCYLFSQIAPEYFANPLMAFYSVFKIFTVEGWYEIPDLIASRTSEWVAFLTRGYFAVILVTGGIFGLSLVNSIFVDAMVQDNNDELEKKVEELSQKIDRLLENR